jgi:hypothetical protein
MRYEDPAPHEVAFFQVLIERIPGADDWYHKDDDGTLWMTASYDFVAGRAVRKTLRVDYNGQSLRGGWSPGYLNWDDGVHAETAGVDTSPPEGLRVDGVKSPHAAAVIAADWFRWHLQRWEADTASRDTEV